MQPQSRTNTRPCVYGAASTAMLRVRNGLADSRQPLVMTSNLSANTWANIVGNATTLANATNIQFDFAVATISVTITLTNATGTAPSILYRINNNTTVTVASPVTFTMQPSDHLRVGVNNNGLACTGTMAFSGISGIPSIPYTCT